MAKVLKTLVVVLVVAGFMGGLWSSHLWDVYYDDGLHRVPDSAVGRIYIENMHGVPLYTTSREHFLLHTLSELSTSMVVLAFLIYLALNRRLQRKGPGGG